MGINIDPRSQLESHPAIRQFILDNAYIPGDSKKGHLYL